MLEGESGSWAGDLSNATAVLHHRGPDDQGLWRAADGSVGLGHRRLSILDLSAHGHQPMTSACGHWMMVFNGEIYNFREIRRDLEALGHTFSGSGDSEVILEAFAQWGPDAVSRLLGMFAIALWHKPTGELHLLRDRLGVKPIYYFWDGRVLAFASELKGLRAFSGWTPAIDTVGVQDFLRYGYISHPTTIYRDVFKLSPGCRLRLRRDGVLDEVSYWNPLAQAGSRLNRSDEDLTEEAEALMISAFNYRMIADVPVGVFLSGGVDSSLVSAILQKNSSKQIRTFTIGFGEHEFNEAPFAEEVARYLGTQHTTRQLNPSEALKILPSWGDLYDEPFGDEAGIPSLLISQVAAQDVKVVLSADGGDELFSGYTSYESVLNRIARLERIPPAVRKAVAGSLGVIPWHSLDERLAERDWGGISHRVRATTTLQAIKIQERIGMQPDGEHFQRESRYFSESELTALIGAHAGDIRQTCDAIPGELGDQMSLWDINHYLPEAILAKVDRATMAASIEGREPLLDHRLVEFAFSIPFRLKHGPLGAKHLLKKILYRYVPRELVDRRKRGFSVPLGRWFSGELRGLVERYLEPGRVRAQGIFNPKAVASLMTRLRAGDPLAVNRIWLLLAFQMWHERWME